MIQGELGIRLLFEELVVVVAWKKAKRKGGRGMERRTVT